MPRVLIIVRWNDHDNDDDVDGNDNDHVKHLSNFIMKLKMDNTSILIGEN